MPTCFIRTKNNETIVDLDCSKTDLHCVIDIKNYTKELINKNLNPEFINDIYEISEIRGAYWEQIKRDTTPFLFARELCNKLADKWDLYYTED